jgi:protein SCO1/2
MKALLAFLLPLALFAAEPLPPCCRPAPAAGPATDKSLYLLDSTWTSDVGRQIKLGALRGRPQVVAMFFTHCEYACPILVSELKTIEGKLPADVLSKIDFLLVSIDSKRDVPSELATFRTKRQLTRERWTLLHGAPDDVRELAALLGVNYAEDARGQFAHTSLITLLNAEGEIAFQHAGLKQDLTPLIAAIQKVASQAQR